MDEQDQAAMEAGLERFLEHYEPRQARQALDDAFESGFLAGMDHCDIKRRDEAIIAAHRDVSRETNSERC